MLFKLISKKVILFRICLCKNTRIRERSIVTAADMLQSHENIDNDINEVPTKSLKSLFYDTKIKRYN